MREYEVFDPWTECLSTRVVARDVMHAVEVAQLQHQLRIHRLRARVVVVATGEVLLVAVDANGVASWS